MNNNILQQQPSAMQLFGGRVPSVPVTVGLRNRFQFDTKIPDFTDVAKTQPEMDAIVARLLWFMHWDDFNAGSHAAIVAQLVGACCPVQPETVTYFAQWS